MEGTLLWLDALRASLTWQGQGDLIQPHEWQGDGAPVQEQLRQLNSSLLGYEQVLSGSEPNRVRAK